jgi:hypothetical protein
VQRRVEATSTRQRRGCTTRRLLGCAARAPRRLVHVASAALTNPAVHVYAPMWPVRVVASAPLYRPRPRSAVSQRSRSCTPAVACCGDMWPVRVLASAPLYRTRRRHATPWPEREAPPSQHHRLLCTQYRQGWQGRWGAPERNLKSAPRAPRPLAPPSHGASRRRVTGSRPSVTLLPPTVSCISDHHSALSDLSYPYMAVWRSPTTLPESPPQSG